jgi:hypothetical protein
VSSSDRDDLEARVHRLEAVVALLQAQLAASPVRAPVPTDPDLELANAASSIATAGPPEVVSAIASPDPDDAIAPIAVAPIAVAGPAAPTAPALAARRDDGIEATIGTYWLSRLGIVALVTGIAWFIAIHFGDMSPALRVLVGYGLAAGISALGAWVARSHRLLGHVVLGGGLAVGYFVTYALHFIAPLRMIEGALAASLILAVVVAAIVALGHRLHSETVVGVAIFLGFHTTLVGEIRAFTLLSTAVLATASAYTFVRNRWLFVPLSSMVAVYASHGLSSATHHTTDPQGSGAVLALAFVVLYFLVFAGAAVAQPAAAHPRWRATAPALATGNVVLFGAFGVAGSFAHDRAWLLPFLIVATLLFLGTAAIAHRRGARALVEIHLAAAAPALAWVVAEAAPAQVAAVLVAVLGAAAVAVAVRAGMSAVAISAQLTLVAALAASAWLESDAFVAPFTLGVAFVACTLACRATAESSAGSTLRPVAAGSAAVAWLVAGQAVLSWSMQTLGGAVVALVLIGIGLASRERSLRFAGLAVLALAAGKLLFFDLARLPTDQRILTFVASGAILLALSYGYARFKARLGRLF